ncbi:MAG: chemotaxis protein CheA [Alphaproteobacteria bacterium]|nr:chemotaxis protein CheA [Alphaproteobacteria bacterium]
MDGRLSQFLQTYFEECRDSLSVCEPLVATLGEGADQETINTIFRCIHSIKGGGAAFGFERLVAFCHGLETALEALRSHRVVLDRAGYSVLVRSFDMVADLVAAAQTGVDLAAGAEAGLARDLQAWLLAAAPTAPPSPCQALTPSPAEEPVTWRIQFAPESNLLRKANEPLLLIRELSRLGQVHIIADTGRVPDLDSIDPEAAYLAWDIDLTTTAPLNDILEVFEFVTDDCRLTVAQRDAAANGLPARLSDDTAPTAAGPESVAITSNGSSRASASAVPTSAPTIRVDLDKVDRLANMVGEIVIAQSMLAQRFAELGVRDRTEINHGLEQLAQYTRDLQDSVMAIRAQPVKSVFQRMPRIVRDVAALLGKEARVVTTGEQTEIDKTVIEQLADPLTHLVRNAVDHGLEPPDERDRLGKPREGTISLSADHRGGRIVIEIADDGRGINRPRVLEKARNLGLIAEDHALTDADIDALIFLPGFSTNELVSEISGRGVGMDVVKRNIQALGGRISVTSTAGEGSRFSLSLPLTLAVLDGLVVAVGAESYIIPIQVIVESLRPRASDVHRVVGRGDVLALRGSYVPLVYLHRVFEVEGAVSDPSKGIVVIIDAEDRGQIGLVVDDLLGQQQVVVKSLEANYEPVQGIGGATILGSGQVALILDAAGLATSSPHRPGSDSQGGRIR